LPALIQLTSETFTGPWAGLPVSWGEDDRFDERMYRAAVAACCRAGIPGVYTGGTTGEFYAQEFEEFERIARATAEECRAAGKPAMIGCTATYTLGAVRRAALAADIGAAAIQVALPFWMEVADDQIVPFFRDVAAAAPELALSIYDTNRARKSLSLDQHRRIKEAVPNYLMVKSTVGTLGATPEGCQALSTVVNVFVGENLWATLGRLGAKGGCSSAVYWNPRLILGLWRQIERRQWDAADATCTHLAELFEFLASEFRHRGFTDTAFDRLGAMAGGGIEPGLRSRMPYPAATTADVARLRAWYREHWPEMLDL
jgi:dihydrodipicolinate synthase/N-acetylneuraminate lyase